MMILFRMASAWLRNDMPDELLRSGVACVLGALTSTFPTGRDHATSSSPLPAETRQPLHESTPTPVGSHLNRDQGRTGAPGGLFQVLVDQVVAVFGFVDHDATPVRRIVIPVLLAVFPGPGVGEADPDGVVQVE